MTVASPLAKAGPFLDTGGTSYPFGMQVLAAADIKVVRTTLTAGVYTDVDLAPGADFTVTTNPDQESSPGGSVTTTASVPGTYITIARSISATQGAAIPNQGGFYPEVLERALDKLTMLVQQLQSELGRALLLSPGDTTTKLGTLLTQIVGSIDTAASYASASAGSAGDSAASASASDSSAALASQWASKLGSTVDGVDYSAKHYASVSFDGAALASQWAVQLGSTVDGVEYSAKKYAQDAGYAVALANNWATRTDAEVLPGQGYGAKKYAQDAALSAVTAAQVGTSTPLTGLALTSGAAIAPTSTILQALGQLQRQKTGAMAVALTYTAGRVTKITEDGADTTIAYNGDGTVNTIASTVAGKVRTETYSYSGGVLTGMTATEI